MILLNTGCFLSNGNPKRSHDPVGSCSGALGTSKNVWCFPPEETTLVSSGKVEMWKIKISGHSIPMFDYALRIQALDGYASKLETLFSGDRFSRTIRIHHTGKKRDNPHYHLAITTDYKKDALRKELKKHFTLATGNKHLSLKDWDGSLKYIAYLLHEDTEPDLIKGITEEEINQARDINEVVQHTIKSNTKSVVIQECVEYFSGRTSGSLQIFSWLYDRFKASGEWMPNKYQYERYIDRVQATLAETPQEIYDHKKALLKRYGWIDDYSLSMTSLQY